MSIARLTIALAILVAFLADCAPVPEATRADSSPESPSDGVPPHGAASQGGSSHGAAWSYEGETGPERWGRLASEYLPCDTGRKQSPIDLSLAAAQPADLGSVETHYGAIPLRMHNNGHTVQIDAPPGNEAVIQGETYSLQQLHFHAPSEHTVDGVSYALEMHLVHRDAKGRLAVIGVFFETGKEANADLAGVVGNLPARAGETSDVADAVLSLSSLVPDTAPYFRYDGSLTTPPCTEGVLWTVLIPPLNISEEQAGAMRLVLHGNHRPAQARNGRVVQVSGR